MRNYQALIDDIRSTFATDESISPDFYRSLAGEYAVACNKMTQRLKSCVSYLHAGNAAETVRLAETEPNLFDIYNLLDFPEREEWRQVLDAFGFQLPPFPSELARQLDDAYTQTASLEPLLKKYRVFAIQRAPLGERLMALRSMTAIDPTNTGWLKDQELFEQERLKTLDTEVEEAVASGNLNAMRALQKELSQQWSVPIPNDLKDKLSVAFRGMYFQSVTHRLKQLVEELLQTYDDQNADRGLSLLNELQETIRESGMAVPIEISDRAEPAVRWLDEEKKRRKIAAKYNAALEELKEELQQETSADELLRLHNALTIAAQEADAEIPAALEELYDDAWQNQKRKNKRRFHMRVAGVAVGVIAVLALTVWILHAQNENHRQAVTLSAINQFLNAATPDGAEQFLQELETKNKKLLQSPLIAESYGKLREKIDADKKRHEQFLERFEAAKKSTAEGTTLDATAFEQAEKSAKRNDEEELLASIRPRFEKRLVDEQQKKDAEFETKLTELSRRTATVLNDPNLSLRDWQNDLQKIADDFERLIRTPEITGSYMQRAKKAAADFSQTRKNLEAEQKRRDEFQILTAKIGDAQEFVQALKAYAEKSPRQPESADFLAVTQTADGWKALLHANEFRQLLANVRSHAPQEKDAADAAKAAALYDTQFAKIRGFVSPDFKEYAMPYLQTAKYRTADPLADEKPLETVLKTFRELAQREVWTIVNESPTGAWYYLTEEPKPPRTFYPYITDIKAAPKTKRFDPSYFKNLPKVNPYKFSQESTRLLEKITPENWSDTCYRIVQTLNQADGIDPILKAVLLKRMIETFAKCDPVFADRFKKIADDLKDVPDFDGMPNWMDGEKIISDPLHRKCGNLLTRMSFPTSEEIQAAHRRVNEQLDVSFPQYRWIGYLLKKNDRWEMVAGTAEPASDAEQSNMPAAGTLCVVHPTQNDAAFQYEILPCGKWDAGKNATLDLPKQFPAKQGEPVFVKF
ncbi:MAG: hypothetical protein LBJ67_04880 [Planctomycetaceae bacterium]|jgi:hypothetical protein|nr:hypothetical protein [Planctomycetaceae bacterium]